MPKHDRTYAWDDTLSAGAAALSGLDLLTQAARDGGRSPVMATLGFDLVEVSPGQAVLSCHRAPFLANHAGILHGGVVAALLDSAAGAAVHTTLRAGDSYSTVAITVTYQRPITPGPGVLQCVGSVLHVGRTMATATAEVRDETATLFGHAVVSLFVIRRGPVSVEGP